MFKCEWYVNAEQIDPYNRAGLWKVEFLLTIESGYKSKPISTLFSVLVEKCFSEDEAIGTAFAQIDERNEVEN